MPWRCSGRRCSHPGCQIPASLCDVDHMQSWGADHGRTDQHNADARCGLFVIHLPTGDVVHWLRIEGLVRELYDVVVLPNVTRPTALGFKTDEIQRTISIGSPQPL